MIELFLSFYIKAHCFVVVCLFDFPNSLFLVPLIEDKFIDHLHENIDLIPPSFTLVIQFLCKHLALSSFLLLRDFT